MNTDRHYGDWRKLTLFLLRENCSLITLTDDQLQEITGSIDENKPYDIDFDNPNYCIRQLASAAGYSVVYATDTRSIEKFSRAEARETYAL